MGNVEIERKFLIKELPENIEEYEHHEIEQGYLCTNPVVRIRKSDDEYYMTYKGKGLMERAEYNLPLNEEAYYHLREKADGNVIKKTRYVIPLENPSECIEGCEVPKELELNIELDVFESPSGLIMAEVEFPSRTLAEHFTMPEWFLKDVTDDSKYHNSNMIYLTVFEP